MEKKARHVNIYQDNQNLILTKAPAARFSIKRMSAQHNDSGPPISPAYLRTMPKFIREASPLASAGVRFNSAFPPLTTDKRYRGVYERAGFDVLVPRNSSNQSLNQAGKSSRSRSLSATDSKPRQRSHLSQPTEPRNFTSPGLVTNSDTQLNYLPRADRTIDYTKTANPKKLQLDIDRLRTYDSDDTSHPLSAPAFTNQSLDFNFGNSALSTPSTASNKNSRFTSVGSSIVQADGANKKDQVDNRVEERTSSIDHHENEKDSSDSEYHNAVEDLEGYDSLDEFDSKFVDKSTDPDREVKEEIARYESHDSSEHDQLTHLHQMNHEFRKSLPIDMAENELPSFLLNTPGLFSPQANDIEQFKSDKIHSNPSSTPRAYNSTYGSSSSPIQYHEDDANYRDLQSQMTTIQEATEIVSETDDKASITWKQADVDDLDDLAAKADRLQLQTMWDPLNDSSFNEDSIAYSGTPETSPLQEEIMDATINNSNSRNCSYATSIEFEGHLVNNQNSQALTPPAKLFPPGTGPCRKCNSEITGKSIWSKDSLLSGRWHRHCFGCSVCETPFKKSSSQCYVFDDKPYCSRHFHELNGSVCRTCDEVIEGQCLENEALEKFHLHCLVCSFCSVRIYDDYFVMDGQALCEKHGYEAMQQHLDNQFSLTKPFSQVKKRRTHVSFV